MNKEIFISYQPEGVHIVEPSGMHFRELGGLQIYTPHVSAEVRFRMLLEAKLRQSTETGDYTGEEANKIIKTLFAAAHEELEQLLPRIASRSFFEFLVFMHSQWGRVMMKAQQALLGNEDAHMSHGGAKTSHPCCARRRATMVFYARPHLG